MPEASKEYCLQYEHDGELWALNFFAVDDEDAERKVRSIRRSLTLKGELMGRGDTLEEAYREARAKEMGGDARRPH